MRRARKRTRAKKRPSLRNMQPKMLLMLRNMYVELAEIRNVLAERLPLPIWGQTPSPGPSGTSKPYQQFVNPIPVTFVKMNDAGDWVAERKDGTPVPAPPPRHWWSDSLPPGTSVPK